MDYVITINEFEGPLDLLLHLIKESNIDIIDIKIEDITKQYLDYIEKMEELNLNIASSYLVMAAELIEMKASYLLPRKEEITDEYEEDPRENLIKRLLEYQNYKEVTSKFQSLEQERKEYYTKEPSDLTEYDINSNLPDDVNLADLLHAFEEFLKRQEQQKPLNTKITSKEYSVSKRSQEIKTIIHNRKKVYFHELFEEKNRSYVVVTFLSILVLVKNKEIAIEQPHNFENILLCEVKS